MPENKHNLKISIPDELKKYYVFSGPINWFLSLRIWEIMGKLNYTIYIVHMLTLHIQADVTRNTYFWSYFELVS